MGAIGEFFTSISTFFKSISTVVTHIFTDIITVLKLLWETSSHIITYVSWLPASVVTLVLSGISVVVIYKVIGRD